MAFQNKGSSIFEYGSHLPLIKLSGYTLCVELLIKKYLESINDDIRYSDLLLFLFDIIDGKTNTDSIKEIPFDEFLTLIQNNIPQIGEEIAKYVYNEIHLILNDEKTDLFSYFEEKLKGLIPSNININDKTMYLSKSSLFGMYHRKLMICYNHSSFSTLNKFLKNIENYHDTAISIMSHNDNDKENKENKENILALNDLKYPYDLDENIYNLSKMTINIEKDMKLFEILSDSFPDLPSTHYLNCIENMKKGEYIASLSYLHKYFDFVASSFKINWSNIINNKSKHNKMTQKQYQLLLKQKRKKMQYSLLCRAMFYAYFGHYNLAIQQITEALQRAQNIGDRECVASSLYLLVEFLSDQSGNVNLIKQIYENCIQNVEAIPSVHIGSLIGLSKWNLYHISIYHTKSRPWYLWEYLYFAQKMIVLNNNNTDCNKYFAEIHSLRGNAWNLYGNKSLSSISYQIFIKNHIEIITNNNMLYINIANYLQNHCEYIESIDILKKMNKIRNNNNILNEMGLILLLEQSINCRDLKLATIYQTRLAELIPSSKDNLFLYLKMMYLHSQIRFEHKQYMEASRIINNLISLCNQRSLQSITIPYYLFLSKIHLKCHNEITIVMSYILKAWSLCKSYHFYFWIPECTIFLSKLHLKLNNFNKSFNLIQEYLPIILKKNNYLIVQSYIIMAKSQCYNNNFIHSIQYFHIARIWCLKLMKLDKAFNDSCISKELLKEIYYFLAILYQNIGDTINRDKSAQKMLDINDDDFDGQ